MTTYIRKKTRFCKTPPFAGLDALGMWYGRLVAEEIRRWEINAPTARLGAAASEKIALCRNEGEGWQLRRVRTDGVHLQVYDWKTDQLRLGTLLPVVLLGRNLTLLDAAEVPRALQKLGGYRCEFEISGQRMQGWVLDGRVFSAAWSETGRPYHFETKAGCNHNGIVIHRLDGSAPLPGTTPWDCNPEITGFVRRISELASQPGVVEASHLMIMPSWAAESVVGSWTVPQGGSRFALLLAIESHRSKPGTYRACAYAQQLKRAKCTNTADASVHSGNADGAGIFHIQPSLDPPQWRELARRLARVVGAPRIAANSIELGSLGDAAFLQKLLVVAGEIHDLRAEARRSGV